MSFDTLSEMGAGYVAKRKGAATKKDDHRAERVELDVVGFWDDLLGCGGGSKGESDVEGEGNRGLVRVLADEQALGQARLSPGPGCHDAPRIASVQLEQDSSKRLD